MKDRTSLERGLVQVYTGNGKGKTTAALGLSLRAIGRGLKVIFFQFMKGQSYGELESVKRLSPDLTIIQLGRDGFVDRKYPEPRDYQLARAGVQLASEAISSGKYDIVVLDEMNCIVDFNLVKIEELISLIDSKSETLELVITGRNAHPDIIERADLVTEMKEVKHCFNAGQDARIGIEF